MQKCGDRERKCPPPSPKSWRKQPLNDFFLPTTAEASAMSWPKPLLTFLLLICEGKVSSGYGASHSRATLLSDTH